MAKNWLSYSDRNVNMSSTFNEGGPTRADTRSRDGDSLGNSYNWHTAPGLVGEAQAMTMTRDKEIWAIALWVEKHEGDEGDFYIAQQMDRLLAEGDLDGMAMWRKVRERFGALNERIESA